MLPFPESAQEHWDFFRRRDAMYTGENSLRSIRNFVDGYSQACGVYDEGSRTDPFLAASSQPFHAFVSEKLGEPATAQGWETLLTRYFPDESSAIEEFFRLLDEFLSQEQE